MNLYIKLKLKIKCTLGCHHPESHPGYRRHKPRYCSYTIAAWRIRVSIPVLNLAKVVCYHVQQSPGCASIGTRTRILSLEGTNTTLVLWTQDSGSPLTHRLSTCAKRPPNKRVRGGRFELPTNGSLRRRTLQSTALPTELPPGAPPLGIEPRT